MSIGQILDQTHMHLHLQFYTKQLINSESRTLESSLVYTLVVNTVLKTIHTWTKKIHY